MCRASPTVPSTGTQSDAQGRFVVPGIPVGNFYVEAVNVAAHAQFSFADYMPGAASVVTRDITLLDVERRNITVKHGTVSGHVLKADGTTPVAGVPVIVWYTDNSQPGVRCPGDPPASECALAMVTSDGQGGFSFADISAGELRVSSFDQGALSEGQARIVLGENQQREVNVLLGGGLGTVTGVVIDSTGQPVAGAIVGGGLSLTTTNASGQFTLTDVPIGHRELVAVSEALGARGRTAVDLVQAGQTVNATITFDPVGSVSGQVVAADGVTPVPNVKVYLFRKEAGSIVIVGQTTAGATGGFQIGPVPAGTYQLSAFNASFTDGNIVPASLKFQGQNFRTTIRFRGAGGKIDRHGVRRRRGDAAEGACRHLGRSGRRGRRSRRRVVRAGEQLQDRRHRLLHRCIQRVGSLGRTGHGECGRAVQPRPGVGGDGDSRAERAGHRQHQAPVDLADRGRRVPAQWRAAGRTRRDRQVQVRSVQGDLQRERLRRIVVRVDSAGDPGRERRHRRPGTILVPGGQCGSVHAHGRRSVDRSCDEGAGERPPGRESGALAPSACRRRRDGTGVRQRCDDAESLARVCRCNSSGIRRRASKRSPTRSASRS
ncbi:MAG: carboxypeptidase regulatory-like domain-containing protein [Vicinamibacterales bacterium]